MLVEKIVASEAVPGLGGAVADALRSLGLATTAETLAHALRHSLHQVSAGPFAALVAHMPANVLVADLVGLGVEPLYIEIARRRMVEAGGASAPALDEEIERHVLDYVAGVVGSA
ncbi:hypothetical protein BHAOGJBA_1225 [Methylobacterium hispanicum]|uniref:Uncharacterized protein n=1 Tax=Methylobacterium hispanicum TaxID=270350 RepID=A0AAV4ZIT7_9HYPH|nr:hypothetical protein [Methylobacterium hispanicum]GJD87720.1 hypothetical protein BHAOGJBA_1225 [Methylobacterium hispanicum]